MNFVVADHSLSLEDVINMPFALGTYRRAFPNVEGAIASMMGGRINYAGPKHKELISELVNSIGIADQMRAVHYMDGDTEVLVYEPKALTESDNREDLVMPELVVSIPRQDHENPDESLNIIDAITISFWEHPIIMNTYRWSTIGRFYGYPSCCIKTFIDRAESGPFHPDFNMIGDRSTNYPCIVCDRHATLPIKEVEDEVHLRRHSLFKLDQVESMTASDRLLDQLQYLLALQQGKLTPKYDLEDPVS